jgi:hypothetical protein
MVMVMVFGDGIGRFRCFGLDDALQTFIDFDLGFNEI